MHDCNELVTPAQDAFKGSDRLLPVRGKQPLFRNLYEITVDFDSLAFAKFPPADRYWQTREVRHVFGHRQPPLLPQLRGCPGLSGDSPDNASHLPRMVARLAVEGYVAIRAQPAAKEKPRAK